MRRVSLPEPTSTRPSAIGTDSVQYQVLHKTEFAYARPVASSYQLLHLTPRDTVNQRVLSTNLTVDPIPASFLQRADYFGNTVTDLVIRTEHDSLTITNEASIVVESTENILLDLSPPWELVAEMVAQPQTDDAWDAGRFCFPSPQVTLEHARTYIEPIMAPGKPLLRLAMELTQRIYEDFEYQGGVTDVYTPVPEVLGARQGVCQDFAHIGIACLRAFGLPARYISGYLLNQPISEKPRLTGADASHAWLSLWCPEFGWVDFDPTNNMRAQNEHIVLGWGRDYSDVSPTRGFIHGGGTQQLTVSVDVLPILEGVST